MLWEDLGAQRRFEKDLEDLKVQGYHIEDAYLVKIKICEKKWN